MVISFLWKYLTTNRLTIIKSIGIVYKQCLGQSCNREAYLLPIELDKMLAFSFTMVFVIWLMASFVLNKSFTSILLHTYFNVKTTPVVKSLEDVRKRKELSIYGIVQYFTRNLENFKFADLLKRIEKVDDNFQDPITSQKIAQKVINSELIFIGSSFQREYFLSQNKYYNDKIVIANKYYQHIMIFHVEKQKPFSNEVHY